MVLRHRLRPQQDFALDPLAVVFYAAQLFINLWFVIRYAQEDIYFALISIFFICLSIGGLVLHGAFVGWKMETDFSKFGRADIVAFGCAGTLMVMTTQFIIKEISPFPFTLATAFESRIYYFCAAIAEESFFRYFVQSRISKTFPGMLASLVAIFSTSALFMAYHSIVYQGMPTVLLMVFGSSVVLCALYQYTKRISVPMMIHALVNFAVSG